MDVLFGRNYHSIANQLYLGKTLKNEKKKKKTWDSTCSLDKMQSALSQLKDQEDFDQLKDSERSWMSN